MIHSRRGPLPSNWATAITKAGNESHIVTHTEIGMNEKLEVLKKKWESSEPDDEFSIMVGNSEHVYVGRYAEGIVLRVNDKDDQATFLTTEMAADLGQKLVRGATGRG